MSEKEDSKVIFYAALSKEQMCAVCTDQYLQRVIASKLGQLQGACAAIAEVATPTFYAGVSGAWMEEEMAELSEADEADEAVVDV
eukprot:5721976-Amphidinium_carterae.1